MEETELPEQSLLSSGSCEALWTLVHLSRAHPFAEPSLVLANPPDLETSCTHLPGYAVGSSRLACKR